MSQSRVFVTAALTLSWVIEQHDHPTANSQWVHQRLRRELQFHVTILLYTAFMLHQHPHHPSTAMVSVIAAGSSYLRICCMTVAVLACRTLCLTDS